MLMEPNKQINKDEVEEEGEEAEKEAVEEGEQAEAAKHPGPGGQNGGIVHKKSKAVLELRQRSFTVRLVEKDVQLKR